MPNQHHPDKVCVSTWILRSLAFRLKKKATKMKVSITDFLTREIERSVSDVELTVKDYNAIAKEVASAVRGIDKRTIRKAAAKRAGKGAKAKAQKRVSGLPLSSQGNGSEAGPAGAEKDQG